MSEIIGSRRTVKKGGYNVIPITNILLVRNLSAYAPATVR